MNDEDWNQRFTNGVWWGDFIKQQDDLNQLFQPKCECGTQITMGKDDNPSMHSDYCPIYKTWKQDYGKSKT